MPFSAVVRDVAIAGVCVLALGGCSGASSSGAATTPAPSAAMTATARATTPALPAGVTPAMITAGDSIFHANACARCHGKAGVNGPNGPPLAKGDSAKWLHSSGAYEEIVATIIAGVPRSQLKDQTRRFQMNPRGSNPPIDDQQVRAVAAYIWKLNHP